MKYNKTFTKGDGRQLLRGGPRDMQKRQAMVEAQDMLSDHPAVIEILRKEISDLKNELSNRPKSRDGGQYTAEELNDEVNKAVAQTITELKTEFEKERKELKSNSARLDSEKSHLEQKIVLMSKDHEIALKEVRIENKAETDLLKAKCDAQEDVIKDLKDALSKTGARSESFIDVDSDRPQMEEVFIDPLDASAGDGLESHIKVEDVPIEEKEAIADKVDKLKSIMGKLKK